MTLSPERRRTHRLIPLLALLAVSGCAEPRWSYPPLADLSAASEAKPAPTADITTSARAGADYSAAVEAWGDRVSAAGGRLCRYFVSLGVKVGCPAAPVASAAANMAP